MFEQKLCTKENINTTVSFPQKNIAGKGFSLDAVLK